MFLTRSFNRGGAERQLVTLAIGLKQRGWRVSVACFYSGGPLQGDLEAEGIPIHDLAKLGRWDVVRFLWRLASLIRKERPAVVHGYLPVANIVVSISRLAHRRMKVVWGVRASNVDPKHYDWLIRPVFCFERILSRTAHRIIVNSNAGLVHHASKGFLSTRMEVIHNGIDTERFCFDESGRRDLRHLWNIPDTAFLVGLVARLDPMKDHLNFLQAAATLIATDSSWRFVCVGEGPAGYKSKLADQANQLGLANHLVWAGPRDDMTAVYSALDIASSSSFSEGFPNMVAEAMACGRPCVVTDVGDSADIVGSFGIVVCPRDAVALTAGLQKMRARVEAEGDALRFLTRRRIQDQYSTETLVDRTIKVLQALTGGVTQGAKE